MNKKIIIGIGIIILVILLCIGYLVFGQKTVETASLFVEDGMLKYKSNGSNEEIISLEELLTKDDNFYVVNGKEIEFSIQNGYIVWNYVGKTKINKLIAIEDLVGRQGANRVDGKDGVITEIAIFQGKINRSDIDRDYFNLCSGGFLYNNANI